MEASPDSLGIPDPAGPTRVGVLGGTFDPVHVGHVAAAEGAAGVLGLARVVLVPAGAPPHKLALPRAGAADRLAMARLAVAGRPGLGVSDVETRREGPSYTVDTVRELATELAAELVTESGAGVRLFLLLGTDALRDLPTWRDVEGIFRVAEPVAVERPGEPEIDWDALARSLPQQVVRRARANFVRLERGVDVSSTEIRRLLAAGEPMSRLLAPEVERYIRERGLYGARRSVEG
ncbi:MAG: nicotinate-nucleotide adenylyltransferase [Planctomycetota bacterium]